MKKGLLQSCLALVLAAALCSSSARAADPIKIGELFPYTSLPEAAVKWQQGWKLALDEVNAAGGIAGHPLQIISRDDKGNPSEAIHILEDYQNREQIKIVFGTVQSHVGLAASAYAKRNHMLLFRAYGGTSDFVTTAGHDLFLTLQPPCDMWSGLMAEKAAASGKTRWAFVAADYAMSRSLIDAFQRKIKLLAPQTTFVETQYFPIGKLDAGAVAQAVARAKPDGLFVVMWGADYLRFVREGRTRGLFDKRFVMGPYAGYEDYIKPLGREAPVGWFSADGYPFRQIQDEKHKQFLAHYRAAYHEDPGLTSLLAFDSVQVLAQALQKVGTDDPDKVVAYIKAHAFEVPGSTLTFRADGVSNMGDWVGLTGFEGTEPTILNPSYVSSEKYLPSAEDNMSQWKK